MQSEPNITSYTSNSSLMKNTILASHTYLFAPATAAPCGKVAAIPRGRQGRLKWVEALPAIPRGRQERLKCMEGL